MPDDLQPPPPPAEDLQFQNAQFTGDRPSCAICNNAIDDVHYRYAGHVVCESCVAQRTVSDGTRGGILVRSTLFGLGAALAGFGIYALVSLTTGYQLALISILVGWMVGKAMRHGAGGLGGRKFQVVAVLLTYGAISISYLPGLIRSAQQRYASSEQSGNTAAPSTDLSQLPSGEAAKTVVTLIGFGLIMPFLYILDSPAAGLLNALIIFFGLAQAWRLTRGDPNTITGPFRLSGVT
jgi:hypothetical protein